MRRRLPDHRIKGVWTAAGDPTGKLGVTKPQSRAWRLRWLYEIVPASTQQKPAPTYPRPQDFAETPALERQTLVRRPTLRRCRS